MGPLADWERRTDILQGLARRGMLHLLEQIFKNLNSADLRMVCRVNSTWLGLVKQLIHHGELSYLSTRWKGGEPKVRTMQCTRTRSVCTITSLAADDSSIAAGLGSSGKIELWNRGTGRKELTIEAHTDGIYTLQLARYSIVSGGEDGVVRIWSRQTGQQLTNITDHSYIVWCVQLLDGQLVTASYDCTVCYTEFQESEDHVKCTLKKKIQGPWDWADALYMDPRGTFLVVHCDETFKLMVWNIASQKITKRLAGHTDEVHAVDVRGNILVSGASDRRILVWSLLTGECLVELLGHQGKVWSIGIHRTRLASGGRYGEVRLWHSPQLEQLLKDQNFADTEEEDTFQPHNQDDGDEDKVEELQPPKFQIKTSRPLLLHPKSTSVSSLHIDSFCLITGDGLATLVEWDFWNPHTTNAPSLKYTVPVVDPILL